MNIYIRPIALRDKHCVVEMMRVFYASPAVLSNGTEDIFSNDVDACISDDPYLEGYVFEEFNEILGYAMVSKGFSTEWGKHLLWVEDIYVKEEFRGKGIGKRFFSFLSQKYPNHVVRLEAEKENEKAIKMYKKNGFEVLPYLQMVKNRF